MPFEEEQRFKQWWLRILMLGMILVPLAFALLAIALNDGGRISAEDFISVGIVGIIAYLVLFVFRLETRVDDSGVHYRFFPFHFTTRTRTWDEIECAYVRMYSPLGEYGGWGIRSGFGKGMALNVSGNVGLQLKFRNGKMLLIGTNRKDALEAAMQNLYKQGIVTYKCTSDN